MSPAKTRSKRNHIYKIEINDEVKLVRATSRFKAVKHVMPKAKVVIPSADDLVKLVQDGILVEDATL